MREIPLAEGGMLSNAYSEIWNSLTKVGHLTEWLALLSESMGLESETKQLIESSLSLLGIRSSIAEALAGIFIHLGNELNGEEGEERERERGVKDEA